MAKPRAASGRPLTRRAFVTGALAAPLARGAARTRSADAPPNLLFLLSDDQRWDTLGCTGHPLLETPHIDGLAAEGVLFENAFVTTSICPSNRACILSGQHMRTHGLRSFADSFSPAAFSKTYPALLRASGYRTGFVGKYGVGASEAGLRHPSGEFDFWRGLEGQGAYFQTIGGERRHSTRVLADQAIEFLEGCSAEQPWCLSVSFKAPHHPWVEFDPALGELFEGQPIPFASTATAEAEAQLPEFIRDSLSGSRYWRQTGVLGDGEGNVDLARLEEWIRYYYRLVQGLDLGVGRILSALSALGFAGDTVVLFTSDNGYMLYEHGLLGKWLMYEESIRVPMIVRDPRLPDGRRRRRVREMALTIDCAPTMLALAGLPPPPQMQGRDLTPLLAGRKVPWRDDWFYEHTYTEPHPRNIPKSEGVRTDRWKYIRYIHQEPDFEQLFDLETDPGEMRNLAGDPAHARVLERLRARYRHWLEALPCEAPDPDE